jgi:hypothetical protein
MEAEQAMRGSTTTAGRHAKSTPTTLRLLRRHPHLYQINAWAWLERLSRAAARPMTLADVPNSEWDRLRELGFDLIYLLGVWQRSAAGRRHFRTDQAAFRVFDAALPGWTLDDVVGSPFSIKRYDPDPRIGTWGDLDRVRAKLHARGMRLMLDFVVNHTGPDHPWIARHPDYFVQGSERDFQADPSAFHLIESADGKAQFIARGRDPYFAPWADTAQLNHGNAQCRAALIGELKKIARHCDGLRCDMAMLALNDVFARTWGAHVGEQSTRQTEFWEDAFTALPGDFVWMAEVYWDMEARLLDLGFDFSYDKRLYDRLLGADASGIRAHLAADVQFQQHMARFIENHDEQRSVRAFGRDRVPGLAALIATLPGLRFFHDGQFEGKAIHLPMPLCAAQDEAIDAELARRYAALLAVAADPALHAGEWKLLELAADDDDTHRHLIAYRWRLDDAYWLVVVNFSSASAHGRLFIADDMPEQSRYTLTDKLDGAVYRRDRTELETQGLYVRLQGYGAHLFRVGSGFQDCKMRPE